MNKTPVDIDQEAILLFHDLAEQRDNYVHNDEKAGFTVSSEFRHRFFSLLDALNLRLIDDRDNFSVIFSSKPTGTCGSTWTVLRGRHSKTAAIPSILIPICFCS